MLAVMVTCAERRKVFTETLTALEKTDWSLPIVVCDDSGDGLGVPSLYRIERNWLAAIRVAMATEDTVLFLEDDLLFNKHLQHNVLAWVKDPIFYGRLYRTEYWGERPIWGAQAIVMTPQVIKYVEANWQSFTAPPDERMPVIASRLTEVQWHKPSLVDHRQVPSTWGEHVIQHSAVDFDPEWITPV